MLRILTSLALFHWAALFSLLTALCVFSDIDRVALALGGSGGTGTTASLSPLELGVLALCLALCACLFFWSALTALSAREPTPFDDAVVSTAFATATVILSALSVLAVLFHLDGLVPVVAVSAGLLLTSFLIVRAFEKSRKASGAIASVSAASVAARLATLSARPRPQPSEAW